MRYSASFMTLAAFALVIPDAGAAPIASVSSPVDNVRAAASGVGGRIGVTVGEDIAHGWGHRRRHRHGRSDFGDVLATILAFGGALAVVDAIGDAQERRERNRQYPRDPNDRRYDVRDGAADHGPGINAVVEDCLSGVEAMTPADVDRSAKVESVDEARRVNSGWQVEGRLTDGARYLCEVGPDGEIENIQISEGAWAGQGAPGSNQASTGRYDGSYYAAARARLMSAPPIRRAPAAQAFVRSEGRDTAALVR